MRVVIQISPADYSRAYYLDAASDPSISVTSRRLDRLSPRDSARAARSMRDAGLLCRELQLHTVLNRHRDQVSLVIVHEWASGTQESGYATRLRSKFPNAILAYFYSNPVQLQGAARLVERRFLYDVLVTYYRGDAIRHDLTYHAIPLGALKSRRRWPHDERHPKTMTDLFFVGLEKGRGQLLLGIHHALTAAGGRPDFNILDAPEELRGNGGDINWHQRLSYRSVVERVRLTKSLLDLVPPENPALTLRVWEAMLYGRRLVTNNKLVRDLQLAPGQVVLFDDPSDIDLSARMSPPRPEWSNAILPHSTRSLIKAIHDASQATLRRAHRDY